MREAAAWFARLRGPDAEANREAFEEWLRRGALHRSAYNRAAEIFAMGKMLAEGDALSPEQAPPRHRKRAVRFGAAAALVSVCAIGLLTLSTRQPALGPPAAASLAAQTTRLLASLPGETRLLHLPDGSRVRLGQDTIIEVRFAAAERILDLKRGQARFEVFHGRRPFIVRAGGGSVTARGTMFDVALSLDRKVKVHLIEGLVDVDLPRAIRPALPEKTVRRLHPGESISFDARPIRVADTAKAAVITPALPLASQPAAAQDFERITLHELVAAANRSAARPIRLADAATGRLRLSGRFRIDDTKMLAERLAVLFDLSIESRPDEIVLRSR
jgi:transmembrane sensor